MEALGCCGVKFLWSTDYITKISVDCCATAVETVTHHKSECFCRKVRKEMR